MDLKLKAQSTLLKSKINITGSKSESNRALLLKALYPNISIQNLSNSDDTRIMKMGLETSKEVIDVHHAGTAMRFLTAYFATQKFKKKIITGSQRMKNRPIKLLVTGLRNLGADITYLEEEGFPPLKIKGKAIDISEVRMQAHISSQYISALMLVAPKLKNGLKIHLEGQMTSAPYIQMTMQLLYQLGILVSLEDNVIEIRHQSQVANKTITIESDWSSASYYYSFVALANIGSEITLSTYKKNSLQGDSILPEIYKKLGVVTCFEKNYITLKKVSIASVEQINLNLSDTPDIAQTIAVSCFGLNIPCYLEGLHTLKIKETDRLLALYNELTKLGANISTTDRSLTLAKGDNIHSNVTISTYHDHRMAMSFAPLCLKVPITITESEEVNKSYPNFWQDLSTILS